MSWQIRQGDCCDLMRAMPAECVQCVVTSPPYYGLRNYSVDGQIGLESTPTEPGILRNGEKADRL